MRISVVVPNYNHADYLPRSLRALLRQEPAVDEIIVVDDASTDQSIAIVEALARTHPQVRLLRHAHNRGAPAALNTGLAAATGELIAFAAADDFVLPGFFAAASAALSQCPAAAYFCARMVMVDPQGRIVGFRPLLPPSEHDSYISSEQARRMTQTIDNWAVGPSVVYRRRLLQDIGGFDEQLGSLCDGMTYRLLAFRHGFYYSDRLVVAYESRFDTLSARAALSQAENTRMIAAAKENIARTFPPPINQDYPELFVRRLRFNMARLALMAPQPSAATIADLAGARDAERRVISRFVAGGKMARKTTLIWLALKLRPFGVGALLRAYIRKLRYDRFWRADATRLVNEAVR